MANLRLSSIAVSSSTSISATFSHNLNEDIGTSNVEMDSQTPGVPIPLVLDVSIIGNTLTITTQPLTPLAAYFIKFVSTEDQLFNSLNGDAVILNDGSTNRQLIIGPMDSSNPVKEYLINFLRDNVYTLEDPSLISKYIQSLAIPLSKALYDIKQAKNENYLSFTVTDEAKTRGSGAFDRLNEEGAYEIIRVGLNKTSANANSVTQMDNFPSYPVSLQSTNNIEDLTISSVDKNGTFNLNTFTLNLSKNFAIILNSVTFVFSSSLSAYDYDIEKYGYQILDSKYDPDFSFTYVQLSDKQIRLNDKILGDPLFSTENIAFVQVNYQYKDAGKIINSESLIVDTIIPSGREVVPAIENVFTLKHAPIVDTSDKTGTLGSITFIDPNALPGSNDPHPAFLYEITFRLDYLPSKPGEYSVDYNTGNVYVYGSSSSRDGTGAYPPLASYLYRFTFKSQIDYVYDVDFLDLVSLPYGSLVNSQANIIYNYEQVLAQGVDYKADTHIEVLEERIENRLVALNAIQPLNFPVTNVFRIFNETSGEIYKPLRWTDNKIYFNYNKAPSIIDSTGERASFQNVLNQVLFVSESAASGSNFIFKILLDNNNIIASTEDSIGSSVNTSVYFSNTNIFIKEIYFDAALADNTNNVRLYNIGDYQIDYKNGIVWCLVSADQDFSIGSISYKRGYIDPNNKHVITVDDIYYQSSILSQKTKQFNYTNFSEGSILPSSFDVSDEAFFMSDTSTPYQVFGGVVGEFIDATFTAGVTSNVKFVRGLYEHQDLLNNTLPLNFATATAANGMSITVTPLEFQEYNSIQFDGSNYYVILNTDLLYKSPSITISISVVRLSDSAELWDGSGTIVLGSPFKLILSGVNSPQTNDAVNIVYSYTIQDLSRVVIDYNKGDYYFDYSYLADEIIISYEYGDNVLDFRQSDALSEGDTYYVSYKAGALRDALLANFGTLINIPILNNLDVGFERERYRDALMAAMQSFTKGPTVASIKNIVNTIVHTPPEVEESAFTNWSIGSNLLSPQKIETTGEFSLPLAKYDNGVLIDTAGQTITFPISSNLRLEQGSFETWLIPGWNGIDNQSDLTIKITKDGSPVLAQDIFIGPGAFHPELKNDLFSLNINDKVLGVPNKSKDGVFIYYTSDPTGNFNRWYVDVLDGYNDGYEIKNYKITITTNGKFYDVKSLTIPLPASDKITSGTSTITYSVSGIADVSQGITFVADAPHYIFDFGQLVNLNRFSLFKDESGYLNFKIIDKNKNVYIVSTDVSSWKLGEKHHVAASWILNTKNSRDEMHLFIDGFEVPNIIKYGSKVSPFLHEKFRTINPEEIIGFINDAIVASVDLVTAAGSTLVSSSINFSAYGILPGGTLYVEEPGFSTFGYNIISVSGQTLTLSTPMPLSGTNLKYSVNKTNLTVSTEIDLYPNIAVSLLRLGVSGSDLITNVGSPSVSSSVNFETLGVEPGDVIVINEIGFLPIYTILDVAGNALILNDDMPSTTISGDFLIYPNDEEEIPGVRALRPAYEISRDSANNVILTVKSGCQAKDIVLIRTLGLNNRIVDNKYYLWNGTSNPNPVNTIMTRLPAPVALSDVDIKHILLDGYNIGPSNSTLIGSVFNCGPLFTDQPSLSDTGRTLSIYVSGSNVDYSTPVMVTINGVVAGSPATEGVSFIENGTKSTVSKFESVTNISVSCKPIDTSKNCIVVVVKELYPITTAENSSTVPIIRYSYQILMGTTLSGSGNTVTDANGFFSGEDIGNYLIIKSPSPAAGQYKIINVSNDHLSATISGTVPSFTNGLYEIINTTTYRTGLQNGFFTFELAADGYVGEPYNLVQGLYEFEYNSYLSIPLSVDGLYGHIGSDINGNNLLNGTLDDLQIVSEKLTDTRIGETAASNQQTITKDFNALKASKPSSSTLMLLHFDYFPFTNNSDVYTTADKNFIQSSTSVNENFGKSICITDTPILIDNTGILTTKKEGSIEFWVSPLFDTANDPNYRFYFDATTMVSEQLVSTNNATVKLNGTTSEIVSVKLKIGDQKIDYFAGGSIDSDSKTIYLNKALPNQQTPVVVNYIPNGTNGDRISIYKDPAGYVNFDVRATGIDYQIRSPAYWIKNTWHRLKAMYKFNTGLGSDEIKFFVDGYERGSISFGNGLLFGQGQVFGSTYAGRNSFAASIIFTDTINELFLGSDYTGSNGAYALIDNLRISDMSRPLFLPFGESIDVNYSSNIDLVFPVTEDLYTTLLLNFNTLVKLNKNFAVLKNKKTGLFDFSVSIFDSFDILKDSAKVKQVMEILINTLKPANSRVFIRYK